MSLAGPDTESVDNFANSLNSKKKQAISKFLSFQDPEAVFFFQRKALTFNVFLVLGFSGVPGRPGKATSIRTPRRQP